MELLFAAVDGADDFAGDRWPALVMPSEEIEAEIERLAKSERPDDGRRRSMIVHPRASLAQRALAPGIDVALNVLLPGEKTEPRRSNAAMVAFCIRGTGLCVAGQTRIAFTRFDTWNIPSMAPYAYENSGDETLVFLSYSNAPVLKELTTYYEETTPPQAVGAVAEDENAATGPRARDAALNIAVGQHGARILGYEYLVDIDVVRSVPLHWPWAEVSQFLGDVEQYGGEHGRDYQGRHLVALYNPATERRIGTSHSFFASIAQFPPGRVDTPHRHTSAAINYIFAGSGRSTVDGRKLSWKSGDIMLSAPGWAIHNHASGEDGCNILTIQDHPFHLAAESLLWQETLKGPVMKLGGEVGVQTNISSLVGQ